MYLVQLFYAGGKNVCKTCEQAHTRRHTMDKCNESYLSRYNHHGLVSTELQWISEVVDCTIGRGPCLLSRAACVFIACS